MMNSTQIPKSQSLEIEMAAIWARQAARAASGGNAQPWVVKIERLSDNRLLFRLGIDSRYSCRPSPMDVDGKAALMALGCYAVYVEAFAALAGFEVQSRSLAAGETAWETEVSLVFRPVVGARKTKYSEQALQQRWTDRRVYETAPCPPDLQRRMQDVLKDYSGIRATSVRSRIEAAIGPLRKLEALRWKNKKFRDSLFEEIDFSSGKDAGASRKIPASQLGVEGFDLLFLRLMHRYPALRTILSMGGSEIVARKTVPRLLRASSGVWFLQAEVKSNAAVFNLGRCFQELWLVVNDYGYSFQPIGLPLVALSYWSGDSCGIGQSPAQTGVLREVTEVLREKFDLDLKELVLGFRFGATKLSQSVSSRLSPRAEPQIESSKT